MRLRNIFFAVLLFVVGMASAQQLPPIPVDKAVRIGKLDNGLTYYIRHNEWPENVANFYIAQRVGSIQENDDQRGLAHFLEHMAFNGSEHYPDSTLLEYTRSIGVGFGSDLNAYTSIDETVYRICNVPTKRAAAIDSCMLILKDWSNGLTLDAKEIDKERGVIHQEWRLRTSPIMRIFERTLPKLYPGSKYGYRMPIGLMEIIDNFEPKFLRDYYKKWYRPDNQAIIVVGDVDVDHIEKYIKELWNGVTVPADAAKVVDEPVPDNEDAIYVFDKDKEQQYTVIGLSMKHDPVTKEEKESIAYLMDQYAKDLIVMMLNQRFEEAAKKADCPYMGAGASIGNYIFAKTKGAFDIDCYAKEGKDIESFAAIYREAQRVRQFGFTPGELDRAKAEYMSQLEKQFTNRNKIKNDEFGDQYRDHFLENEPIPSIEDEYQIMQMIAPNINVDIINAFAKELISDQDKNLVAYMFAQEKEGKTYPTEADMAAAVAAVRAETLTPYVDNVKNEPLIKPEAMPKAGKIKKETENKTLGYKELTLSNGARVILKKTDFKDDEILFQAVAEGGKSLYGAADYENLKLFGTVIGVSGLGNFSKTELQKALSGKQANISFDMQNRNQIVSGNSVPKDIETMMQLAYLTFTNIAKDEESYNSTMTQLDMMLKNKSLRPESVFSDSLTTTLYNHDARFTPIEASDLAKINYDRVLQIAKERLAYASDYVFYFVGNFDEATLRPLIEKYIASLPGTKKKSTYKDVPGFATGMVVNNFKRKMETPKATAFELWHMPVSYTLENSVMAEVAGELLSMVYLKDIREDAGAAYSVSSAGAVNRSGDKVNAVLQTYCPMDPDKAETVMTLLAKGMKDSSVKVDADKVAKIKENLLKNADVNFKSNSYWMNYLDEYIYTGVDFLTDYKKTVSAVTPEKVAAYLKTLSGAGNRIEVVMLPEK